MYTQSGLQHKRGGTGVNCSHSPCWSSVESHCERNMLLALPLGDRWQVAEGNHELRSNSPRFSEVVCCPSPPTDVLESSYHFTVKLLVCFSFIILLVFLLPLRRRIPTTVFDHSAKLHFLSFTISKPSTKT